VLQTYTKEIRLQKNQFVYKEGDLASCFYLVKEGEIKILQKEIEKKGQINPEILTEKLIFALTPSIKNRLEKAVEKFVTISILGPKQMFGEEALLQKKYRESYAKCSSLSVSLFCIEKRGYFNNMQSLENIHQIQKNIAKNQD